MLLNEANEKFAKKNNHTTKTSSAKSGRDFCNNNLETFVSYFCTVLGIILCDKNHVDTCGDTDLSV